MHKTSANRSERTGPKFIMLIHVEMPITVGILTFMRMINKTAESLKERKVYIFQHFRLNEQFSLAEHEKCCKTSRSDLCSPDSNRK